MGIKKVFLLFIVLAGCAPQSATVTTGETKTKPPANDLGAPVPELVISKPARFVGPKSARVDASDGLSLRESPDQSAPVLLVLDNGAMVTALEQARESVVIGGVTGSWTKVAVMSGDSGWVFGGYLTFIDEVPAPSDELTIESIQGDWVQVIGSDNGYVVNFDPYSGPKTISVREMSLVIGFGQYSKSYEIGSVSNPEPGLILLRATGHGNPDLVFEVRISAQGEWDWSFDAMAWTVVRMDPGSGGHALDEASYPFMTPAADGPP